MPSPTPNSFLNDSLRRSRSAMICVMSASLNVVSIAAVCWASTRRRAMVCRRFVIRTRSSLRSPGRVGAMGLAGVGAIFASRVGSPRWSSAGAAAGAGDGVIAFLTSCFITRPADPVPWTPPRSTLWSSAMRRAVGVVFGCSAGAAVGADAGAGADAAAFEPLPDCAAAGAGAPAPFSSTTASSSPILTSSPSLRAMLVITPRFSALSSRLVFSVSSSTSGSPTSTWSPGFFSHLAIRASTMDSPSTGTTMLDMLVVRLEWRSTSHNLVQRFDPVRLRAGFERTFGDSVAWLPRSKARSTSARWLSWCHADEPSDGLALRARPM